MDALLVASTLLVVVILAGIGFGPALADRLRGRDPRSRRRQVRRIPVYDPGRERRAERRARELMRSILTPHDYAMYVELGFVRLLRPAARKGAEAYGYLIYPHRPIVAYDAGTGELLSEYCVRFPDRTEPALGERLPDADDVLAKWMALHGDERSLIEDANMHVPGRQLDPGHVRRDLGRLAQWEARRAEGDEAPRRGAGTRAATA
jgi:hypothetical protein